MDKTLELALISARLVTGDVWNRLTALDLTDKLNDQKKWSDRKTPELREITFHSLVVMLTELILEKQRIPQSDNTLRLCSMFVIQILTNQAKPELKMEMIGWLEKSKKFYLENSSIEAQEALLKKLEELE